MMHSAKIAQFNTCDVENFGDLLYPVLLRRMLCSRSIRHELTHLGFLAGPAPCSAGYSVRNFARYFSKSAARGETLVVGGGDILRTDLPALAHHYETTYRRSSLLQRLKRRIRNSNLRCASEFEREFHRCGNTGPFVIERGVYPTIRQVIYCSCGVPFPIEPHEAAAFRDALGSASFIYLRDEPSRQKLLAAGVEASLHVAPDLAVMVSDFFDPQRERAVGRALLKRQGVRVDGRLLCFQCHPVDAETAFIIRDQLLEYQRQSNAEIILLPLGRCHDDPAILQHLMRISDHKLKYADFHSIFQVISVIAACDVFAGTSLHGNVTAFSLGIPQLFCPAGADKFRGFGDVVSLPSEAFLEKWSGLCDGLMRTESLDRRWGCDLVREAKRRVDEVMDQLIECACSKST